MLCTILMFWGFAFFFQGKGSMNTYWLIGHAGPAHSPTTANSSILSIHSNLPLSVTSPVNTNYVTVPENEISDSRNNRDVTDKTESVEHSNNVENLTQTTADEAEKYDSTRCHYKIIVHDVPNGVTSDIPHTVNAELDLDV